MKKVILTLHRSCSINTLQSVKSMLRRGVKTVLLWNIFRMFQNNKFDNSCIYSLHMSEMFILSAISKILQVIQAFGRIISYERLLVYSHFYILLGILKRSTF